jgi:Tfp pilus assembly protein PilV
MSRATSRRARRAAEGFTVLEVMMALTVLVIGVLGVMVLQTATLASNQDAAQVTVASNIARLWLGRLQRDGTQWNHPSTVNPVSNLSSTIWLNNVGSGWFVPATNNFESAGFNVAGLDVTATPLETNADYCTQVRLSWLQQDALIRAEVRVIWPKRTKNPSTWAMYSGNWCQTVNADSVGKDELDFHALYATAAIRKVPPQ